jgi:hypothetical protein
LNKAAAVQRKGSTGSQAMRFWKRKSTASTMSVGLLSGRYPSEILRHCETFAASVADARGAKVVTVSDFLAGFYLTSFARSELRDYWADFRKLEQLVFHECGRLRSPDSYTLPLNLMDISPELVSVCLGARHLASLRKVRWRGYPVIDPEHMLYFIATEPSRLGKALLDTGLDMQRLGESIKRED